MQFPDRVKETSSTVGTTAFVLGGAAEGMVAFSSKVTIGAQVPYCAVMGPQWEVGIGTLTSATALARTTVLASSDGTTRVSFAAGVKEVFSTVPGALLEKFVTADAAAVTAIADPAAATLIIEVGGVAKRITMANFMAALGVEVDALPVAVALADGHALPIVQGASEGLVTLATLKTYLGAVGGGAADTTGPTMGGTLTSSGVTATGFTLSGYSATDAVGVTGYEYSLDSGSTWTNAGNTTSIVVTGRTASTTYPTRVRAYDAAGNRAATPLALSVTTAAASGDTTAPTMSGSLTSSNVTETGYTLSWTAGADNVGVTGYEYSTDAGTSWVAAGTSLTVAVTGKTASTTYDNRIRCFDAAGLRSNVLTASVTTAAAAATAPGAPTIGTAVAGDGYIDVAFTAPANNGGSPILDYTATLSTGETATGASSPIRVTCANGTARTATVTARNGAGPSAASAASNSVTPAAAGPTMASLYNVTAGPNSPSTATFVGGTDPNRYWSVNFNVYVRAADNTSPAGTSIKFVWGKSATTPPTTFGAVDVQYSANGGNSGGVPNSIKTAVYVADQVGYPGLCGPINSLYGGGTAGAYYLWVLYSDGSSDVRPSAVTVS